MAWSGPDRELMVDHAASEALRTAYAHVITPFDQALMPLCCTC